MSEILDPIRAAAPANLLVGFETADEVNSRHTNDRYLKGYALSPELRATASLEEAEDPSVESPAPEKNASQRD